jgi:hypothetical protein
MTKRALCFAIACALTFVDSSSPAQQLPQVQVQQQHQITLDPCLTAAANQTKSLLANVASVSIVQPPLCKLYVGDFIIASTSSPPNGFNEHFTVSGTFDAGKVVTQDQCAHAQPEVKIYKKTNAAFTYVGGGKLVTTFHPETNPPSCAFAEAIGYTKVSGKIPASGTETYRVTLGGGLGSGIAKIDRKPKQ